MEREFLAWLRENLPHSPKLPLAISDDGALLSGTAPSIVVTSDLISDGTDFLLQEHTLHQIGRKGLAINLSDLAAMACTPLASLVSIAYPHDFELRSLQELYRGIMELGEELNCPVAGGDTNAHDGPLVLCVTALGTPLPGREVLRRSGAEPGDRIIVTGEFGGSILGHHLDFQPRLPTAIALHQAFSLHAGMDVSDGLALDAHRLADASGCGIVIDPELVPIAAAACELAKQTGRSPLEHALGDGEDFELLLALPPEAAKQVLAAGDHFGPITEIGECIEKQGLWQRGPTGHISPLPPTGYLH